MRSVLNVGVIGLGEVAQVIHLPVLQSLPQLFSVQAGCDISATLVKAVGDRFGIPNRYLDYREMIEAGGLDAVLVLNSDEFHAECAVAALDHGLHVLVEKPMCLSPREAEQVIAARDRTGLSVMVGYMRRFAPAFLEAAARMPALGQVHFARVHDVIGRNSLIIDQTAHVVRPDDLTADQLQQRWDRGGALVRDAIGDVGAELAGAYRLLCGLGSHDFSAMRELLGPPSGVAAARMWRGGGYLAALIDYPDYVVAYETGVDEQLRFDAHLEVYGDLASMRIQYDTPYVRHLPTTLTVTETSGTAFTQTTVRPHYKDPYTAELEYFHDAVVQGHPPKTSPEDFVADLDLFAELVRVLSRSTPPDPSRPGATSVITPGLTDDDVATFRTQGYLLPGRQLYRPEKLDALEAIFDSHLADKGSKLSDELDTPHFRDPRLLDYLLGDEVLDLVEPLVGPDIALWTSHFISKDPFTGRATPWHEDSAFWNGRFDRYDSIVTVWLALGPSNRSNGCMRVIPGTHLDGGFHDNYVPTDMTEQTFHAAIPDVEEDRAVYFELERGQFSLHDGRIVHGALPNRSPVRRTGYTMRYFPASVKMMPVEQNEGWKIWLARGEDRAGNTYENVPGS